MDGQVKCQISLCFFVLCFSRDNTSEPLYSITYWSGEGDEMVGYGRGRVWIHMNSDLMSFSELELSIDSN